MNNYYNKNVKRFELMNQYIPIVARVHASAHPQIVKVNEIYEKIVESAINNKDLNKYFKELRSLTQDYLLPDDICESYEKVYETLRELDSSYQSDLL